MPKRKNPKFIIYDTKKVEYDFDERDYMVTTWDESRNGYPAKIIEVVLIENQRLKTRKAIAWVEFCHIPFDILEKFFHQIVYDMMEELEKKRRRSERRKKK